MTAGHPRSADSRHTFSTVPLAILVVATVAAFSPALSNALVDWDDLHLLVYNEAYQGLSAETLRWMFTSTLGGHYQPLTWLSYAFDVGLWGGKSPVGFHLTNLILHAVTAVGFYFVARELLRAGTAVASGGALTAGAFVAAALFALHPLRVESVAWATERRDVLSGALLMPAVVLYLRSVRADRDRRNRLLLASLPVYALSLLSKAVGMSLPLILLLTDVYPLRRLTPSDPHERKGVLRRIVAEKVPYVALAGTCAAMGLLAQAQAGALRTFSEHPMALRVGQAAYGIVFYLGKLIWPADLIPLYELDPTATGWEPRFLLSITAVVAVTVLCWVLRRRLPSLGIVWLAYIVLLSPVLGLAQSGPQIAADRYTYLPSMPWAIWIGGGAIRLWRVVADRSAIARVAPVAVFCLIAAGLIGLSRAQTRIWKDSYTLWTTVIERAPHTGTAHANLAALLNARGEHVRAREHALRALDRLPGNRAAHAALGRAALALGEFVLAEKHLRYALEVAAVVGKSDRTSALALAAALTRQGKDDETEAVYRRLLLTTQGEPDYRFAYAGFLASRDRFAEAAEQLERVLARAPDRTEAWFRLGVIRQRLADFAAARDALEAGLGYDPSDVTLRSELAWLLATCPDPALRDGERAVRLAAAAQADAGGQSVRAAELLAAAYAELGDFESAVSTIEPLLTESPATTDAQRRRLQEQLHRYREGAPWRQAARPAPAP